MNWIPFFAAIAGGCVVVFGQTVDRYFKDRKEKIILLRDIYTLLRTLEAEMRNNYRELAMAKVHVEYWWYCHKTSPHAEGEGRYYEEHLRSQIFAREVERKIGDTKAKFIGEVYRFQTIKSVISYVESDVLQIANLSNKKAKGYSETLPVETVRNSLVEKDEKELREEYYKNLQPFQRLCDFLFTQLNVDEDLDF